MRHQPKAYMLVPIFNRTEHIPQLLNQLKTQDHCNFELILVDHSPTPCLPQELPTFVTKLRGTPEMWWSGAINVGIKYALSKESKDSQSFIIFMNDDVIFGPNLISGLISSSQKHNAGIGPITLDSNPRNDKVLDANNYLNFVLAKHISPYTGKPKAKLPSGVIETDILKGRGVIYPIQTVLKIGLTNERLHYRADPEYAYRAKKSGLPLYIDTSLEVKTSIAPQKAFGKIRNLNDIKAFLFSPKSSLNLKAASIYFFSCTNPLLATWSTILYTIRWTSICFLKPLIKRH